jgi:WD40 repeat protein
MIRLWDVESGKELKCFAGHTGEVWAVAFCPSGRQQFLSAGGDKTVRLWDLETGEVRTRFLGHTDNVLSVAFSPDGRRALSGGTDKTVRVWGLPWR